MSLFPRVAENYPSGLPEHQDGEIFYVNYNEGTDSIAGGRGRRREKPFASIAYALTQCSDDHNDVIYVTLSVHVEDQPIVVSKRGVQILGLPKNTPHAQQARTWIFPDAHTTGGVFTISAGDVVIKNFMFWSTAGQPCIDFTSEATAVRVTIDQCSFHVGSYGIQTGLLGAGAINAPSHYLTITNCLFDPGLTSGGIQMLSNGSWNLIADNFFEYVPGPVIDFNILANSAGSRILRNQILLPADDTVGDGIYIATGNTRCVVADNDCNDGTPTALGNNPYIDVDNLSMWFRNTCSGVGFTDVAPA